MKKKTRRILAILALLLICYILYLVLLSHAKKALATA